MSLAVPIDPKGIHREPIKNHADAARGLAEWVTVRHRTAHATREAEVR